MPKRSRRWIGGEVRGQTYWIDRWRDGRRWRFSTRCVTLDGARAVLAKWEASPPGELHGVRETPLGGVVRDYLTHSKATNSSKHLRQQIRAFNIWATYLAALGVATLEGITPGMAAGFIPWRRAGGAASLVPGDGPRRRAYPTNVGEAAVNRDLAALKALFSWALRTGIASENPLTSVPMLREHHHVNPHRYVEREDILRARAELEDKWADMVTVLYGTAFRYDSAARLTIGELDARRSVLRDPRPKGKVAVEVAVSADVFDAAKRMLGRVYPRDEAQQLGRRLRSACERAAVKRFTAHDLRVSAATWLHEQCGWSVAELQRHLGHASAATTERYIRARMRGSNAGPRGPV